MTASEFLTHGLEATFWVSMLTILALALRGPVTQRFGSRAAMLLWLLPALRLIAPTLTKTVKVTPAPEAEVPLQTGPAIEPAVWMTDPAQPAYQIATSAKDGSSYTLDALPTPIAAPEPALGLAPVETTNASMLSGAVETITSIMGPEYLASLVLSVWFLGVLIAFALCFARASRWRQTLLAEAKDVPAELAEKAEAAAERAGATKPFTLVVSAAAETPQLMGLGKPLLALPQDFQERYDDEEQEMALLHELTHLRRRDLSVLMASEAAFALQWFNPLTRHARKALRSDQEAACDEAVRGLGVNTKSYAALLLKAASMGRPLPALTLDHSLKERLLRMQNPLNAPLKRYAFILTAGVSALAVAGFTASSTTVVSYVQEDAEDASDQRTDSSREIDDSWDRFLSSADKSSADADERWSEYVARVEAADRAPRAVSDDEWAEAGGRAAASSNVAREETRRAAREESRRVYEQAREQRERAREQVERAREQREFAQEQRERAQEQRERAMEQRERAREIIREQREEQAEPISARERLERIVERSREMVVGGDKKDKHKSVRVIRRGDNGTHTEEHIFEFDSDHDSDFPIDLHFDGEGSNEQVLRFLDSDSEDGPVVLRFSGEMTGDNFFAVDGDAENVKVIRHNDESYSWISSNEDMALVLLSDPFADIEQPNVVAPPAPVVAVEPPVIERRETEEGTWILIPNEPDMSEFEEAMEEFEVQMEAFGERMGAWGERMGNAGEAVGELADMCDDHTEESDKPKILSIRIEDSRERVRALCVSGGAERLKSDKVKSFMRSQNLSSEERERFEDALRD